MRQAEQWASGSRVGFLRPGEREREREREREKKNGDGADEL
jgi:hypothetical protein